MKKYVKLLAAACMSMLLSQVAAAANTSQMDIVDVAMHNKNLSTLVTAIKAAGLVETLKGAGPYTVFAPTNAAFNKLPKGTLDKLLKDKTQLAAILTYHVVPGKVMVVDVNNGTMMTVQGQPITLTKTGANVQVNNGKVVKADIPASNGVIHEINVVLLPQLNNNQMNNSNLNNTQVTSTPNMPNTSVSPAIPAAPAVPTTPGTPTPSSSTTGQ